MSDTNLSADKVRTMLADANERLRKASAEYFDLLEKGLNSSQLAGRRPGEAVLRLSAAQCHRDIRSRR